MFLILIVYFYVIFSQPLGVPKTEVDFCPFNKEEGRATIITKLFTDLFYTRFAAHKYRALTVKSFHGQRLKLSGAKLIGAP